MKIHFDKYENGLIPAIVQDARTGKVLMHGHMNRKALKRTEKRGKVTFYSRSRKKLWTKGEKNGNFLEVTQILTDGDRKSLLIKAIPKGKICRNKTHTCFNEKNKSDNFLLELEEYFEYRKAKPTKSSPTTKLFNRGINQISKKVGEEAVELVIEAINEDDKLFKDEASDLLHHFMVLLVERGVKLEEVLHVLRKRRR